MKNWFINLSAGNKGGILGIALYALLMLSGYLFVYSYLFINPNPSKLFPFAVALLFAFINFPWYAIILASQGKITVLLVDRLGIGEGWFQIMGAIFSIVIYFIVGYLLSLLISKFRSKLALKKLS